MLTLTIRGCVRRRQGLRRRGAATVEMALVAPFLLISILSMVDVGQYVIVAQTVSNASREAGRMAARYTTTNVTEVQNAASSYLTESFTAAAGQTTVRNASGAAIPAGDLTSVPSGSLITVEVVCPFDNLRWVNMVPLLDSSPLKTITTVRRE